MAEFASIATMNMPGHREHSVLYLNDQWKELRLFFLNPNSFLAFTQSKWRQSPDEVDWKLPAEYVVRVEPLTNSESLTILMIDHWVRKAVETAKADSEESSIEPSFLSGFLGLDLDIRWSPLIKAWSQALGSTWPAFVSLVEAGSFLVEVVPGTPLVKVFYWKPTSAADYKDEYKIVSAILSLTGLSVSSAEFGLLHSDLETASGSSNLRNAHAALLLNLIENFGSHLSKFSAMDVDKRSNALKEAFQNLDVPLEVTPNPKRFAFKARPGRDGKLSPTTITYEWKQEMVKAGTCWTTCVPQQVWTTAEVESGLDVLHVSSDVSLNLYQVPCP
jgi:hypothetical protein